VKDKGNGSSEGNWKEKEKEKEKEEKGSPVLMMLSDGCIEDMSSMLFTTVVANLSVIVGHDIDGQPLPLPSDPIGRPTLMTRLQKTLDPCDLLKRGGHHRYLQLSLLLCTIHLHQLFKFYNSCGMILNYIVAHHIVSL
jgi:hypothetical protein